MSEEDLSSKGRLSRPDEITKRLLELMDRRNYQLVQENGQRRLFSNSSPIPRMKGAEIFIGRLPRDCYEDEIVPVLERVGYVVELRLMMDFSGSTRGYAFALFENTQVARMACTVLNGYQIRPGHRIGVVKSIDNCRLFLGGVPKDKSREDFMHELSKMLEGITNVYLYPCSENKTMNRGFVFVEFKDHRSAAMARRKLIPGRVMLWDHEVAVDWADPEPGNDIEEDVMETVTALFLRNLPTEASDNQLRHAIQKITGIPIIRIKKINHFAFLHYETRDQAERALNIIERIRCAEFENLEVAWAKPIRKSEKLQERLRCKIGNDKTETNRGKRGKSTRPTSIISIGSGSDSDKSQSTNNTQDSTNSSRDKISSLSMDGETYLHNGGYYSCNKLATASPQFHKYAKSHTSALSFDDCTKGLAELAANTLGAVVRYEYSTDNEGLAYGCKIAIERGGLVMMQYEGNIASTLDEALYSTFRDAFLSLRSMLRRENN